MRCDQHHNASRPQRGDRGGYVWRRRRGVEECDVRPRRERGGGGGGKGGAQGGRQIAEDDFGLDDAVGERLQLRLHHVDYACEPGNDYLRSC